MITTNDVAKHVSPGTLRKIAVGCMAAGVALDAFTMERSRYRAVLLQTRSTFWRRFDRPGGALVVAGLALLRTSAPTRDAG